MTNYLGVKDVEEIALRLKRRAERFPDEEFTMSIGVVLLNYGERHVKVECMGREWAGTKGDLQPRNGVPLCPNGHPLLEVSRAPRLALVDDDSEFP